MLSSLAWVAVTAYGIWRLSNVIERIGLAFVARLGDFKPLHQSLTPPPPVPIPDDLASLAFGETEAWAKEEVLRAIREKYDEYHDWSKVRVAFGVAQRSE